MTDDDESFFDKQFEHDREICSNCYRRVRTVVSVEDYAPEFLNDSLRDTLADDIEHAPHTELDYPPPDRNAHSFRRVCECGCVDTGAKIRPLSKEKVMTYVGHIADRLDEKDFEFDEDVLYDTARAMKENPEYQFDEERIFEAAICNATDSLCETEPDSRRA